MKKLLIILLFAAITIPLGMFLLDYAVTKGLRKTQYREFSKWNKSLDGEINADIIINGSSRAVSQISPKIFEEETNCKTYNLGIDGNSFFTQNLLFNTYQKHNKSPQLIIQTIGSGTLMKPKKLYNQSQFLPYLNDKKVAQRVVNLEGINSWDVNIPFHRYLGEEALIQVGLMEFLGSQNYEPIGYNGYTPRKKSWSDDGVTKIIREARGRSVELDDQTIKEFESYVRKISASDSKLIFVYTPEFIEFQPISKNIDEIKQIFIDMAKKYSVDLIDFSSHEISKDKKFFSDPVHLNKTGAEAFSKELIKLLIADVGFKSCG